MKISIKKLFETVVVVETARSTYYGPVYIGLEGKGDFKCHKSNGTFYWYWPRWKFFLIKRLAKFNAPKMNPKRKKTIYKKPILK